MTSRARESLRYGENPHQRAALYGSFLELVETLHGKELSFNNVVDVQAALALIGEFDPSEGAACAILKHNTPCGAGLARDARRGLSTRLCDRPGVALRRHCGREPHLRPGPRAGGG